MPGRKTLPPRLSLRKERDGTFIWVIRDRGRQIRTGCAKSDIAGAEAAHARYLAEKRQTTVGQRRPDALSLADVLGFYAKAKHPGEEAPAKRLSRYGETLQFIAKLGAYWGSKLLSDVRGESCRGYVTWRTKQSRVHAKTAEARAKKVTTATARRELEVLRAAINLYHQEYTLDVVPKVTLPKKSVARERYLSRNEGARMLGAALGFVWSTKTEAWLRDDQGKLVRRDKLTRLRRRHVARFFLLGIYTGTRHEAIQSLQWGQNVTGGWIDLDRWRMYRRGVGVRETKKRTPPTNIPYRLRPHLDRWRRIDAAHSAELTQKAGQPIAVTHVVHWIDGKALSAHIRTAWEGIREDAGLGADVVPHVMRHTAITWSMQQGTDQWEASGMFGVTMEVLEQVYGHHHPDFQEGAAGAFGGKRK